MEVPEETEGGFVASWAEDGSKRHLTSGDVALELESS